LTTRSSSLPRTKRTLSSRRRWKGLRRFTAKKIDKGRLEIGSDVLETFHEGNIVEASSTNPHKSKAYEKFEKHPELPVKPATMRSWVRAAAVAKGFEIRMHRFPNLTTYHYVALAVVKDEALRADLASIANRKKSSVQELRDDIGKALGKKKGTGINVKAEVARIVRQPGGLTNSDALTNFSEDEAALKKAYPEEKYVSALKELNASLLKLRSLESLLSKMAHNLKAIVDKETAEPLS
jgi:hypothetical protein